MKPPSEAEVHKVIFAANPHEALGRDRLPATVWKGLYPVLRYHIASLFRTSFEIGKLQRSLHKEEYLLY